MSDPAVAVVDQYWRAENTRLNALIRFKESWAASSKTGRVFAEGELPAPQASTRYGLALRECVIALAAVASTEPATMRGAIDMLTVALTQFKGDKKFSPPHNDLVMGNIAAVQIIRKVQDAMERWDGPVPDLANRGGA